MHELTFSVAANFLVVAGLTLYGFELLAAYHSRGRWAKNITGLLAGVGLLALALALLLTPRNAEVMVRMAQNRRLASLPRDRHRVAAGGDRRLWHHHLRAAAAAVARTQDRAGPES